MERIKKRGVLRVVAWVTCEACSGDGYNAIEDPCLVCGGNGAVFEECDNPECPDCTENTDKIVKPESDNR